MEAQNASTAWGTGPIEAGLREITTCVRLLTLIKGSAENFFVAYLAVIPHPRSDGATRELLVLSPWIASLGGRAGALRAVEAESASTHRPRGPSPRPIRGAAVPDADPNSTSRPRTDRDDLELLRAHVNGDRDAFVALARRHARLMSYVASRILLDRDEVEDVVQSALTSALRAAATFDGRASVSTWLCSITRNAALDVLRRRSARPTVALTDNHDRPLANSSDPAAAASDRELVDRLLAELADDARQIVIMVDMLDLSVEQVAQVLGIPAGTVKSRRHRAHRALARRFRR